jgi:hypothetical protein
MKIEGKITLGGIAYVLFILFCLFLTIGSSIGGWWYLSHFGFSVKQLLINILVSSSTLFMIWMIFTKIFTIQIKKIKL